MSDATALVLIAAVTGSFVYVISRAIDKLQASADRIEVLLKNLPDNIRNPRN